MSINKDKTQIVHFHNPSIPKSPQDFVLGDQTLCIVNNYKYLGLILAEHLDYKIMVRTVATAANRALAFLKGKTKCN